MDPNQPFQSGQYDFITNPVKPKRKSLFSFGKGNNTGLMIIIAAGLGLLTLILLVGSLFFGGSSDRDVLLDVAKKQSEVISIANLGAEEGGTNQAQSLGLAVQLSVTTEQQAVIGQLSKRDKVKPKEYAASPSSEVKQQLETAQSNGRFDEVFNNVIKQELTEYQQALKTANTAVESKSTKTILAQNFESAGLLLQIPNSN